jgi:DNA-binding CsgD family transcriptional regulator
MVFEPTRRVDRLIGRRSECDALDQILNEARGGSSRVVVLRGEPGIGKSALLNHVSEQAYEWRVVRAVGVESEIELAYSALHQLCGPILDRLDRLPGPQREALSTVFGLSAGPAPDRFLVGLAVLTLFAEVAEIEPLLCLVDDAQWIDQASAQIFAFVGRRLLAERVAIVCAARRGIGDGVLAELPTMAVEPLFESDSRALLLTNVHAPLDTAVCDQIVAESHGNPLALLELPRTWSRSELAGGFGLPSRSAVSSAIEQSYIRRLEVLPHATQLLVLTAAAEPLGDPVLLFRAAAELAIEPTAADAADDAGLLRIGGHVEFAHPLIRSAAYRSAATEDRRQVHEALANATDHETDPDRRAWHRARAASGPSEEIAVELERSAGRAESRGGLAAAAAFLERATELSVESARRVERALSAAQMKYEAGSLERAEALLVTAELVGLNDLQRGHVLVLRTRIAFAARRSSSKLPLLLEAAREVEGIDPSLARTAYMEVFHAALHAGRLDPVALFDVSSAALGCTAEEGPGPPRPHHLLLDGLATRVTQGYAAGAPILKLALTAIDSEANLPADAAACLPCRVASDLWDNAMYARLAERELERARKAGALTVIPRLLDTRSVAEVVSGDLSAATATIDEMRTAIEATGVATHSEGALLLAALRGHEGRATHLIARTIENAHERGEGLDLATTDFAGAILNNGLGRYDMAVAVARDAIDRPYEIGASGRILAELVEAAFRTGQIELARTALEKLVEMTQASGTEWALGVEARCRAILSDEGEAESRYLEGIERLGSTGLKPDLARTRLLYGEWLRREGRRLDAREQLRLAHNMLATMGIDGFAERARRELVATGEKARKRTDETRGQLTAQEQQIARLARDGLTNPEIGARLFVSPRTVEWHLRNVFTKLRIKSRHELANALADSESLVPA